MTIPGVHRLAPALVAMLVGAGCAVEPGRTAAQIVGGALDTGDDAVVAIGVRRVDCGDRLAVHCTGTLVGPRLVLTAAHCVSDPRFGTNLEVMFGSDVASSGSRFVRVTQAVRHPDYHGDGDDADLAVLVLESEAPVAPVALGDQPLDGTVGASVRIVGFGVTGPSDGATGTKRSGTSTVAEVLDRVFRTVPGTSLTCQGDSGGPLFAPVGTAERLVGVTSRGDPGCSSYGINVRTDRFLQDFIVPWIEATSSAPPPAGGAGGELTTDQLCTTTCSGDGDCPVGLVCLPSTGANGELIMRCVVPGLLPGTLGEVCAGNVAGAERCVRLRSENTPDACRYYRECNESMPQRGGCQIGTHAPAASTWAPMLLLLLVALAGRPKKKPCHK
ncbi:MAG TPA: trypsin-like serine protease [Kofleriaceae bacterium]|nr:trypsin-like serine protease [Kofleriaceae bacterium]